MVREDGGAIRFRHAVIRGLTGFLEIYLTFGGLAFAVALFNDRSKRLGDMMAGTYAVRSRVPVERRGPGVCPAPAAGLGGVGGHRPAFRMRPHGGAQFLRQAGRMAPLSRAGMAASIATELAAHVAPPPPPGTGPDDYLAAVVAERRNRELVRLTRARRRNAEVGERLQRLPFGRLTVSCRTRPTGCSSRRSRRRARRSPLRC